MPFILMVLVMVVSFFIVSAIIMITYNNSVPIMNSDWAFIDYKTAMFFTLFLMFVLGNRDVVYYTKNECSSKF